MVVQQHSEQSTNPFSSTQEGAGGSSKQHDKWHTYICSTAQLPTVCSTHLGWEA